MTSLHLAPSLLVAFMVLLAIGPLAMIWWDERRHDAAAARLERLRGEVRLREQLGRRALAESSPRPSVMLPEG